MTASPDTFRPGPAQLQRPNLPHPASQAEVEFFSSWESAVEHLLNHVVTSPESLSWCEIIPSGEILDVTDSQLCYRFAQDAWNSAGRSCQPLFDLYAGASREAAEQARKLGWVGISQGVAVVLGTSGVLLVIDQQVLATAFLPGQGDPQAVARSKPSDSQKGVRGLARQRGMRQDLRKRSETASEREAREQVARQKNWTSEERIYYLVFRPAVQFIRRRYHSCRDLSGRLLRCDYALLKPLLPPFSQLKFQDWSCLRESCGAGSSS